jgi:hypothetical protein
VRAPGAAGSDFTLERHTADGGRTQASPRTGRRTDFDFEKDAGADLACLGGEPSSPGAREAAWRSPATSSGPGVDADADGVLDDGDRVPSASRAPKRLSKVERAGGLNARERSLRAGSPTGLAVAKQKVKVKRRFRHGPDRTVEPAERPRRVALTSGSAAGAFARWRSGASIRSPGAAPGSIPRTRLSGCGLGRWLLYFFVGLRAGCAIRLLGWLGFLT